MRGWRIARVLGIGIYIDPSWILIFLFLVWSLSGSFFAPQLGTGRFRSQPGVESIALAIVASLLLFLSVVLHELGHSIVAQFYKIPVVSITLFIFGGVAQIADEPDRPRVEFLIAIAGPITSALLALIFAIFWVWPLGAISFLPEWSGLLRPIALMGQYLTLSNASLALFNLLPGFPLDGGRVLRSLLWWRTGKITRATRVAMYIGRGIAVVLIAIGLASFVLPGIGLNGLVLALVGAFVWNAAGEAYAQVTWREQLRRVRVSDIMVRNFPHVPSTLSLEDFVRQFVMTHRGSSFAVDNAGVLSGLVDFARLRRVPRTAWASVPVSEVMSPLDKVGRIRSDVTAYEAFQTLSRANAEDLVVVGEDGIVAGLVGNEDLSRYIRVHG
jgi:Zn-dependent protease